MLQLHNNTFVRVRKYPSLTKHMGLIPRQPTVEELGWGNSPFPIPAFSLQPFAFSLFLINANLSNTSMVMVNLTNANLTGSNIEEAYFDKSILQNTITSDGRASNHL